MNASSVLIAPVALWFSATPLFAQAPPSDSQRERQSADRETSPKERDASSPRRDRPPAPGEGLLARIQEMRTKLDLSEEQTTRIRSLIEEDVAKAKQLREDTSLSEEQKREKARELFAEVRQKIEPVLSAEQKQRLAEVFTPPRPRGEPGSPPAPPSLDQRLARMKDKLGLSEEQLAKIKPILEENAPKFRALAEDKSLSRDQRREAMKESLARVAAELTPAQREKMREEVEARLRGGR